MAAWKVKLESVGNPDHGQYSPVSNPKTVSVGSLGALIKAAEKYRESWDLGSGNWAFPAVTCDGRLVGYLEYSMKLLKTHPRDHTYIGSDFPVRV